jgi:hypothetical protein
MAKKKKTMIFQASPSERFDFVKVEGAKVKTHIATGRVCQNEVQRLFGEDFVYKVGDVIDFQGRDFTVVKVGEKVKVSKSNIILYQVDLNRVIMDESEMGVTHEQINKWERKIKRILNKQRAKEDEEFRLQQIEIQEKKKKALAKARRKKEKLKKEKETYEQKCATSIGGLDL